MALVDIKQHYMQITNQYFEMLRDTKDLEDAYKDGMLSEEQILQAKEMLEVVKNTYMTWSSIMYDLSKPKRKSKMKKFREQNKDIEEGLKGYTSEEIIDENFNVLTKFKEYVKEQKEERR